MLNDLSKSASGQISGMAWHWKRSSHGILPYRMSTSTMTSAFYLPVQPLMFSSPRGLHLRYLHKPAWNSVAEPWAKERLREAGIELKPREVEVYDGRRVHLHPFVMGKRKQWNGEGITFLEKSVLRYECMERLFGFSRVDRLILGSTSWSLYFDPI